MLPGPGSEEAEPGAIGGRTVNGETILTARLDPDTFAPRDRVAHAGLRTGRRDHDRFAKGGSRGNEHLETGRVNTVIIGDKELSLAKR